MKAVRKGVEKILANGGKLPTWTLRFDEAADAWTLRADRNVMASWREADAPGVGLAVEAILQTLAVVGPVAVAAAKTVRQQAEGGARAAHRNRATGVSTIKAYIATGGDPKGKVRAWEMSFRVSRPTIYRWIKEAQLLT
jgi:hypothetical protein